MKSFTVLQGVAAPMDRANVDTDLIIPKQFLKSIQRSGFGPNLFDELRYLDRGEPGQDCSGRPLNPDFALNQPRYQGALVCCLRGTTSAVVRAVSTRPGRWTTSAFVALSPRALRIFFITIVSRTVSCLLSLTRRW